MRTAIDIWNLPISEETPSGVIGATFEEDDGSKTFRVATELEPHHDLDKAWIEELWTFFRGKFNQLIS